MKGHHLPPGLPKRNLWGKKAQILCKASHIAPDNMKRVIQPLALASGSYHSPRARTASLLTSLFLSSRGGASARSTLVRKGRI